MSTLSARTPSNQVHPLPTSPLISSSCAPRVPRLFAVCLVLGASACAGGDILIRPVVQDVPVTMSMAPPSLTLTAGTSGTLGVVIAGGKPTPVLQLCNSADASIASVAMNGSGCQVSAIAPGTTSITATSSGGQQASSTITVLALPPALLTFAVAPTTAALTVGQSVTLVATATAAAGATITYAATSSNTTIATASGAAASHTVTAIAPGSATITFTATASGPGLGTITRTVTVPVTVTAPPPAITGLVVSPASTALAVGQSATLVPAVTRGASTVGVAYTYASSASSVATVSTTGIVTAVAPGVSTVTVTAQGVGAGFSTTVLTAFIPVTVTAGGACAPVALAEGALVSGTFAVGDCDYFGGFVDHYLLTGPSRVVNLRMTASFGGIGQGFLPWQAWFNDGPTQNSMYYFVPSGTSTVSAISTFNTGSYQFGAFTQPEDVDDCRIPFVVGSIITLQNVSDRSCRVSAAGAPFDQFYLWAPGRSCTITMRRMAGAGSIPDPFIELVTLGSQTSFAQNDDMAPGNVDAQLTLPDCVEPINRRVFVLKAMGWNGQTGQRGGTGSYQLTVTFGPPA